MKKILLVLLISVLFLTSCTQSISEIKSSEFVGEKVSIKGTVDSTIKLGDLSGYTLNDGEETIFVSSNELPAEGSSKRVSGTLEKSLLGYYIKTD